MTQHSPTSSPRRAERLPVFNLRRMMIEAVLIGAFCTSSGLFLSYGLSNAYEINVPTGPLIILIAVAVYGASSAIHATVTRSPGS